MKFFVAFLVLLGTPALVSTTNVAGDKTMGKVVKLLQEMMTESQKDGEKERNLYAKFKCYCDNNEVEKKAAIEETKDQIKMLENDVLKTRASSSELSTECAQLKHDIAENEQSRKDATSLRDTAHEHFISEEEDMKGALDSMEAAITALGAITGEKSLAQTGSSGADQDKFMGKNSDLLKLQAGVKQAMLSVSVWLTQKQKRQLDSFIQAPFSALATSQRGAIVGILKQMQETFEKNIKNLQGAEKEAAEANDKFQKIKEDEHDTLSTAYDEKQTTLGENEEQLSSLSEQLASAEDSLASDQEFLEKLVEMCAKKAKEFQERNLLRANEEAAISQAIAILNSDAAFEAFGKTDASSTGATGLLQGSGPVLLQVSQHWDQASVRTKVLALVRKAARNSKSLMMAKIAALLQGGNPFDSVLKEIEKMVKLLEEEQTGDDEQKDWCEKETEENEAMKEAKESKVTDLKASIEELEDAIHCPETGLLVEIENTEENIKENIASTAKETAARAEEKIVYHTTVKNCVTVQDLLKKATKALKRFYDQFDLVQEDPAPPDTWEGDSKDMKGQKESGGKVIGMLEFILEETKKEEDEAHTNEEDAVKAFEERMKELADELKGLQEDLVELKETLAEKQKLLGETKENLAGTEKDLKAVKKYLKSIKPGCDFIKEHYDTRKENRKKETDALNEATDLLKDTPAYKAAVAKEKKEKK